MRVEQVRFRSGQVRCAADLYLPDGIDDRAPAPAVVMGHSVVMVVTAMARAFGAPPPRRPPRWLFRLAAPYVASFAVDTSMRVTNAKAKAELGWRPAYPTYHDGIRALAAAAARKEEPWPSPGRSGAGTRSA